MIFHSAQCQIINTNCFLKNTKYARIKKYIFVYFYNFQSFGVPVCPEKSALPPVA